MKTYTGIGSRNTPEEILSLMTTCAKILAINGFYLRSGGAKGADQAFETGAKSVNNKYVSFRPEDVSTSHPQFKQLEKYGQEHHQYFNTMKWYTKQIMMRNVFQVLGYNLDKPSDFVLCWTQDGCISQEERTITTGGTGFAISLASSLGIPIFNLKLETHKEIFKNFIEKIGRNK